MRITLMISKTQIENETLDRYHIIDLKAVLQLQLLFWNQEIFLYICANLNIS